MRPSRGIRTIRSAKVGGRTVQGSGRMVQWKNGDYGLSIRADDGQWVYMITTHDGHRATAIAATADEAFRSAWAQLERHPPVRDTRVA